MSQKKKRLVSLFALLLVVTLSAETVLAYSNIVLRKGMRAMKCMPCRRIFISWDS